LSCSGLRPDKKNASNKPTTGTRRDIESDDGGADGYRDEQQSSRHRSA
jgi:hypothetical protein